MSLSEATASGSECWESFTMAHPRNISAWLRTLLLQFARAMHPGLIEGSVPFLITRAPTILVATNRSRQPVRAPLALRPRVKATEAAAHKRLLEPPRRGVTLRPLAQQAASLPEDKRIDQQEPESEKLAWTTSTASWDLSKAPLFSPEREDCSQTFSPVTPLPRPGIIQPKRVAGEFDDPLEHESDHVAERVRRGSDAPTTTTQRDPRTRQSGSPLPFLDTIQRSFGRHYISHVQAHTGNRAAGSAWALAAEAFVQGSEATFLRTPSLRTAAHEAAHVIQQHAGVDVPGGIGREGDAYERHADEVADRVVSGQSCEALLDATPGAGGIWRTSALGSEAVQAVPSRPVVQMRRIPPNVRALLTALHGGGKGANFFANEEGALRLIDRAMEELTPAERAKVQAARLSGLTEAQFNALPRLERRSRWSEAIIGQFPDLALGDPKLIDTGARPATADAANITKLVGNADKVFNSIASGARDTWITQVFGAGSVASAKAKYAKGRAAMNALHSTDSIVTDRSGYSEEISLLGLTDPPGSAGQKIRVAKSVIDSPDANESVTTLLHESMHAGNADVHDQYVGFDTETEANKLTFSSCFEVVAWRILDPTNQMAFAMVPLTHPPTFRTFIPAGTTVSGVTAPPLTKAEEGAKAASELFREAWTIGLNLHPLYVQLFSKPTDWTVPQAGGKRFNNSLPYWSKVEKLTIHEKTAIDPASPDEAKHPVSQIDIALSEGLIRRLAFGMDVLEPLQTQTDILAFENHNSSSAERSAAFPGGAHANADVERDFLLKLTARHATVAPMTGTVARDLRVVRELGTLNWGTVLDARNPSTFPD